MDHRKDIEQLITELSKAHGSIDALTAALVGVLQVMRNDSALAAVVVENLQLHRSFHEGLSENTPFVQGFRTTQTYISEILDFTETPRMLS